MKSVDEPIDWETKEIAKGFTKETTKKGVGDDGPRYESICTFQYDILTYPNAPPNPKEITIELGTVDLPEVVEIGLNCMLKGEEANFYIDERFGENCIVKIHLKDFTNPTEPTNTQEKYEFALKRKNEGNDLYLKKFFKLASRKYLRALDIVMNTLIMPGEEKSRVVKDIEIPCYLNLAACFLEMKQYKLVEENATVALRYDPTNFKALKRRAIALTALDNYDDAQRDFDSALENAPSLEKKGIQTEYAKLKKLIQDKNSKDKKIFQSMFNKDPKTHYSKLLSQITSAISKETNLITITATISAILHESLNQLKDNKVNWTGFYFKEPDGGLVVGPYQGKLACQRIPNGKGVCGMAVVRKQCVLIADVHHCEEHIACDSNSKSEIVFPIIVNNEVMGVLDIDSLVTSGFNEEDRKGLEPIVELIQNHCQWKELNGLTCEKSATFPYIWLIPIALFVVLGSAHYLKK